jgi:hypothetical protein
MPLPLRERLFELTTRTKAVMQRWHLSKKKKLYLKEAGTIL